MRILLLEDGRAEAVALKDATHVIFSAPPAFPAARQVKHVSQGKNLV